MIISVGYRVSSAQATLFRRWATGVLVQFAKSGFVVDSCGSRAPANVERLAELREIIRDIRSDEAYISAVSISVMPSLSAATSYANRSRPSPIFHVPWPRTGTEVPKGRVMVRMGMGGPKRQQRPGAVASDPCDSTSLCVTDQYPDYGLTFVRREGVAFRDRCRCRFIRIIDLPDTTLWAFFTRALLCPYGDPC